ncbi:MAG: hypothetical protein FJW26_03490 [Acidimicrobiia bacterium]|nr:hypothetical protein [Acidimicrobiia bacterium]
MSPTVRELLLTFEGLSEAEKKELAWEILRRSAKFEILPLSDEELVLNAEELFLELDRRESTNG